MSFSISDIRSELSRLTAIGRFGNQTWQSWRSIAGIERYAHNCTYEQWVVLCAAAALHIDHKKVNKVSVKIFLQRNGSDPMEFIPGYLPSVGMKILPSFCTGAELSEIFWEWTGSRPSEWTLRRWCRRLNYEYGRSHSYTKDQIRALVAQYIQIRNAQIKKGKSLVQFKIKNQRKTA